MKRDLAFTSSTTFMYHIRPLLVSVASCLLCGNAALPAEDIRITSPPEKTALTYTVGLIQGELADTKATEVRLVNPRIHQEGKFVLGQAYQGKFKVLAPLRKGVNKLTITSGNASANFELEYKPNGNPLHVKVAYLTDSSGDILFQTPQGLVGKDYVARLATAVKLMQTMTAERMNDLGYGRVTFNLELDENDEPIVHTIKGEKTIEEYYALWEKDQWWGQYYGEVERAFPRDQSRVFLVTPFSRFDEEQQKTFAHAAVGGGRLAFFGGDTLYCWPSSIETACSSMLDTTRIDPKKITDDSIGRSVFWACASTCIGASLHEIGHSMELPHTNERWDIMLRGHDHFFRVFLVREAPSAHTQYERWTDYTSDEMALFAPPSSSALFVSRWFAQNDPKGRPRKKIEITADQEKKVVRIEAENKIASVWGLPGGDTEFYAAPSPQSAVKGEFPNQMEIPFADIRKAVKKDMVRIRVCDANGFFHELKDIRLTE